MHTVLLVRRVPRQTAPIAGDEGAEEDGPAVAFVQDGVFAVGVEAEVFGEGGGGGGGEDGDWDGGRRRTRRRTRTRRKWGSGL